MALAPEVKQYFDTVVIVDDKLDNPLRPVAADKKEETDQAVRLFQRLQEDGFVISPFRFQPSNKAEERIAEEDRAVKLASAAKMLVLDWRLNEISVSKPAGPEEGAVQVGNDEQAQHVEQDQPAEENAHAQPEEPAKQEQAGMEARTEPEEDGVDPEIDKLLDPTTVPVSGASVADNASIPAKEIIRKLLELKDAGMKYVIIYTSDTSSGHATPAGLMHHLIGIWTEERSNQPELLKEAQDLYERLSKQTQKFDERPIRIGTLFITFIDKAKEPSDVLEAFTDRLGQLSGPLALAFLGAVGLMERDAHRALASLSQPIDVPVFMHIGHNSIEKHRIGPFLVGLLWDHLVDGLEQQDLTDFLGSLEKDRLQALADAHSFIVNDQPAFATWLENVKALGCHKIEHVNWKEALGYLSTRKTLDEIREFLQGGAVGYREDYFANNPGKDKKKEAWSQFRLSVELLLAYRRRQHKSEPKVTDFVGQYQEQNALFTRLLTCTTTKERKSNFRTGDIFRGTGANSDKFLLCITPFCDTALPDKKVDHHYKFLVGQQREMTVDGVKVRSEASGHITYIPVSENGKDTLVPVVWDFYKTEVWILKATSDPLLAQWREQNYSADFLRAQKAELRPFVENADIRKLSALRAYGLTAREIAKTLSPDDKADEEAAPAEQTGANPEYHAFDHRGADEVLLGTHLYTFRQEYEFVVQLKKEYAQQVINMYLSYHSRAGVAELYFKEQPSAFVPLLAAKQ